MATVSTGPHITDETSADQSFMDTTIMHPFFAYSMLNINFKGVHMKLKIVGLEISVE